MKLIDVVQVDATTKKDLVTKVKTDPGTVRFLPAGSDPLALAFKTIAPNIPIGHAAVVHGPRGKWQATVTRKQDGSLTVK